jgi:hypothetical protein
MPSCGGQHESFSRRWAVDLAKRSGRVAMRVSPSLRYSSAAASWERLPTLDVCSWNTFLAPAATRSRSLASIPAT